MPTQLKSQFPQASAVQADVKLSREQAKRPSPYWFNRPIPRSLWETCAECGRYAPFYFVQADTCTDCREWARLLDLVCQAWHETTGMKPHRAWLAKKIGDYRSDLGLSAVEHLFKTLADERGSTRGQQVAQQVTVAELGEHRIDPDPEPAGLVEVELAILEHTGIWGLEDMRENDLIKLLNSVERCLFRFHEAMGNLDHPLVVAEYADG